MTDSYSLDPLRCGLPTIEEYRKLADKELFLQMQSYSNNFCKTNAGILKKYRWATDPIHQWSRQWEYPFCYSHIRQFVKCNSSFPGNYKKRVLDAGSGCTFFPYYLGHKFTDYKICCCDYDSSLSPLFEAINKTRDSQVEFSNCELANLFYDDNFFDTIYCIEKIIVIK